MNKVYEVVGPTIKAIFLIGGLGLLMAFPIKWCWNSALVDLFNAPVITWAQALCLHFLAGILHFLAGMLIKSFLTHNKEG